MIDEKEENVIEASLKTDFAQIILKVKNVEDIIEKEKDLFQIADIFAKLNSVLNIRKKYANLYSIYPDDFVIHYNSTNWAVWEKVLLILFNSHNFEAQRSEIWRFNIKQSTLRTIIHDKADLIETIGDDIVKLTAEGLEYINEKLCENLKNYRIEMDRDDNNE